MKSPVKSRVRGKPKVFERKQRTYSGPAEHTESIYAWLDRSCNWRARRARAWVNRLYSRFPDPQLRLLKELRKEGGRSRVAFHAALASLVLFDRYASDDVRVLVDEARQKKGRPTPDLEITRLSDGSRLVIEATAMGAQEDWAVSDWHIAHAVDALNRGLSSRRYGISFYPENTWPGRPDLEKIMTAAAAELRRLETSDTGTEQVVASRITLESNGCKMEMAFYRLNPERPGPRRRIVGVHSSSGGLSRTWPRLLRKLESKKPGRYGVSDCPYVIALFDAEEWFEMEDLLRVLYGRWEVRDIAEHGISMGYFDEEHAEANADVSGVLFVPHFWPLASLGRRLQFIYLPNPFGSRPADLSLLRPTHVLDLTRDGDLSWSVDLRECA
jgi:hypothetical protein